MKLLKKFTGLLLIIILMTAQAKSQDRIKKLTALGRDSLISKAEASINKEYPDFPYETFSRVNVMANDEILYVQFSVPYRYMPLHTAAIYSVSVYLHDGTQLSMSTLSNEAKSNFDTGFYQKDEEYSRVVKFIDEASEKDVEVSSITEVVEKYGHVVTIKEKDSEYEVNVSSSSTSSGYKVEKETGRVYEHWHKHKPASRFTLTEILK